MKLSMNPLFSHPTLQSRKLPLLLALLVVAALAACAPTRPNETDVLNTAIAMAQTSIPLTQTALPTSTPSLTATFAIPTPSPLPTQPSFIPVITPDAYQVEHWKEYQDALAKRFIPSDYVPFALCEWDILGKANQEVYVWAICSTGGYHSYRFAVIHLGANEKVQTVETPSNGDGWASDVQRMFPSNVQEKIASYDDNHYIKQEMLNHIEWRRTHSDEPPLIVLSGIAVIKTLGHGLHERTRIF
ncbi:MAG: hypothetical protein HY869_24000 [Chloroflexi bacterium]|nr:hypothetical protein [Chloroflexota bacterium]